MWPSVWPGVSITSRLLSPSWTVSPSRDLLIEPGQAAAIRGGADDLGAEPRPDRIHAGDVVVVVVGDEDEVEPAAIGLDGLDAGGGVGRVDDRGGAARLVAEQPSVIVRQDRDRAGRNGHGGSRGVAAKPAAARGRAQGVHMAEHGGGRAHGLAVLRVGPGWGGVPAAARTAVQLWPDLTRQSVLGLGYASPYLRAWQGQAERCVAAVPAQVGAARWPLVSPNLSCTVEEDSLPFPDLYFDRILLVHGLEAAENARALLREVWRVLKDDGRLLVVAPNRVGLWAHVGARRSDMGSRIRRVRSAAAGRSLFRVERRDFALYVPPDRSCGWCCGRPGCGNGRAIGSRRGLAA